MNGLKKQIVERACPGHHVLNTTMSNTKARLEGKLKVKVPIVLCV